MAPHDRRLLVEVVAVMLAAFAGAVVVALAILGWACA